MYINELAKSENDIQAPSNSSLYQDACHIIDQAQQFAYHAVNEMLIKRNWLLGMRIQHEVLKEERAEYGEQTIKKLAKVLTEKYGRGFKKSNLYSFVSFYQNHQDFFQPLTGKSLDMADDNIFQSLTGKSPIRLSWTHYSIILQELTAEGRSWYEQDSQQIPPPKKANICQYFSASEEKHRHPKATHWKRIKTEDDMRSSMTLVPRLP